MNSLSNFQQKFCLYGLGTTGKSVINYFNKTGIKNYTVWDDLKKKKINLLNLKNQLIL